MDFFDCKLVDQNGEARSVAASSVEAYRASEAAELACMKWMMDGVAVFEDGDSAIVEVSPDDPADKPARFEVFTYSEIKFEAEEIDDEDEEPCHGPDDRTCPLCGLGS